MTLVGVSLQENTEGSSKKGDVMLTSDHMLEIVTKVVTLAREFLGSSPSVHVTTQYEECKPFNQSSFIAHLLSFVFVFIES